MGSQQQFCLRWNNHQSNMLSVFDDLFQNEALVDVTLACDGLSIKAHKMVLSACSPYFQNLFLDNPCKHPIVILKDIRFTDLKALMDFMYKGEVNVSQEQLSTLLRTAETLKVRGLTEVAGGSNDPLHNSLLLPPPSTSSAAAQQHSQQPTQGAQMTHQQPSQGASSQHQLPRPNGTVQSSSSVNASSLNQHQRPSSSPSPKRKKVRHRPSSGGNFGQSGVGEPSSSQSDYEDSGDSRSHELIEPKVEIMEDCVEGGEEVVQRSSNSKDGQGKGGLLRHGKTAAASQGTAMNNEFAANNSNNTQGVPSSQEASPTNDAQTFTSRAGNVTMNATPPVLFSQPTPPTSLASIGQPPVLQGTSQVLPSAAASMPLLITASAAMSSPTLLNIPGTSRQDSDMRPIPERLRPRPCKICNKIISNASNMIKHMLVHNPVKIPFRCNLCDCKYSRDETLRWHLKVKHGIIRPPLGRDAFIQEVSIDALSSTPSWLSLT